MNNWVLTLISQSWHVLDFPQGLLASKTFYALSQFYRTVQHKALCLHFIFIQFYTFYISSSQSRFFSWKYMRRGLFLSLSLSMVSCSSSQRMRTDQWHTLIIPSLLNYDVQRTLEPSRAFPL